MGLIKYIIFHIVTQNKEFFNIYLMAVTRIMEVQTQNPGSDSMLSQIYSTDFKVVPVKKYDLVENPAGGKI